MHESCDLGTAKMIYWLAQPEFYYYRWATADEAESPDEYAFLLTIEQRVRDGLFANNMFQYDPLIAGMYTRPTKSWRRAIPPELLPPVRSVTSGQPIAIPDERLRQIDHVIRSAWANIVEVEALLAAIADSAQLHRLAYSLNWTGGPAQARLVIQHPACDLGTARLLYWITSPQGHYYRWADAREAPESHRDSFTLLELIETEAISARFATDEISYDPRAEGTFNPPTSLWKRTPPAVLMPRDSGVYPLRGLR